MHRDNSQALEEIYETIGSKQVTLPHLAFTAPWIPQEALILEHRTNWSDAYEEVYDKEVPRNANVISSHVVYKLKTDEDGSRKLKARIVPHGNHDDEKDDVRKDSSNAPLHVIRLLLSLVTFFDFRIATADITGAFLQSGPIKRDIYVRPPREWRGTRGTLWKLLKLPYGIADAGRQWQKVVEQWMLSAGNLQRVFGISQLFTKKDDRNNIILLVAKVTDDFLLGGSEEQMQLFIRDLGKRFVLGKVVLNSKAHFDGCEIEQDEAGNIKMSMLRYIERLKPIILSRARRKQRTEAATEVELKQYRSLACTLMYLGNGVLPQASYVTSTLQQQISKVFVEQLVMANGMLKELRALKPWITYRKAPESDLIKEVYVSTFSDASFNQCSASGYGQSGILTGLRIELQNGPDLFHPIDWCSNKQRRVSYSPYGAEVLACADADDRGHYMKTCLMLHEGKDFRLRPTVQRIRNSFDSQELDFMRWVAGTINPADALTKRNPGTTKLLNEMVSQGIVCMDLRSGFVHNSKTWQ